MQQQERDLIDDLFRRLQQFDSQPRDPEAERLIANYVVRQTSAPYLLTQTVLVQEQALKTAQARIAELEAKAGQAAPAGGFLGSAPNLNPWGSRTAAPPPAAPAPAPTMAPAMPQGGGFLRSALATAAGVAGGALLFEGIRNMFGHSTDAFVNTASAAPSPLLPPDQFSSADLAQDDSTPSDYDTTSDDFGSDDSGFGGGSDDT
ncbi:MAG TPA: DUF2076 domain-containing protein [Reyranella sp.]|nr:DUF2076 domain-containing protein [Reyranella sp.]